MSYQVNLSPDSPCWTKIINHICIDFILGRSSPSPFPLNSSPSSAPHPPPPPPKLYTKKWQNTIIDHHLCVYILASWLLGWKVDRLPKQWNNLMEKKKATTRMTTIIQGTLTYWSRLSWTYMFKSFQQVKNHTCP